jgi:hypothetical protein
MPTGVPLAIHLTGANRNDSQESLALVRLYQLCRENTGVRATVQIACWATEVMTRKRSARVCECEEFDPDSQSEIPNMALV